MAERKNKPEGVIFKMNDGKAFKDVVKGAAITAYIELLKERIKPFEDEINRHGSLIIEIKENNTGATITQVDLPDDLIQRVKIALFQA